MKKETLTPSKKAWRTMRKRYTEQEISERASAAANKAWETIRANKAKKAKAEKPQNARRRLLNTVP